MFNKKIFLHLFSCLRLAISYLVFWYGKTFWINWELEGACFGLLYKIFSNYTCIIFGLFICTILSKILFFSILSQTNSLNLLVYEDKIKVLEGKVIPRKKSLENKDGEVI